MERTTSPVWWIALGAAAVIAIATFGASVQADPGAPETTPIVNDPDRAAGLPLAASNHAIDLQHIPPAIESSMAENDDSRRLGSDGVLSIEPKSETGDRPSDSGSTEVATGTQSVDASLALEKPDPPARISTRRSWTQPADQAGRSMPWYRSPVASLGAVLVSILGAALILRRLTGKGPTGKGSVIDVVSRTPLGVKQTVVLMHVGRRMLLLGISGDRLTPLWSIDDPAEVALIRGQLASTSTASLKASFDTALADESERTRNAALEVEPAPGAYADSAHRTRQHLSALVDKLRTRHHALTEHDPSAAREVPAGTAKTER